MIVIKTLHANPRNFPHDVKQTKMTRLDSTRLSELRVFVKVISDEGAQMTNDGKLKF